MKRYIVVSIILAMFVAGVSAQTGVAVTQENAFELNATDITTQIEEIDFDDIRVSSLINYQSVDHSFLEATGGSNNDLAMSVQQTTDGGYIVVGYTSSYGEGKKETIYYWDKVLKSKYL